MYVQRAPVYTHIFLIFLILAYKLFQYTYMWLINDNLCWTRNCIREPWVANSAVHIARNQIQIHVLYVLLIGRQIHVLYVLLIGRQIHVFYVLLIGRQIHVFYVLLIGRQIHVFYVLLIGRQIHALQYGMMLM